MKRFSENNQQTYIVTNQEHVFNYKAHQIPQRKTKGSQPK